MSKEIIEYTPLSIRYSDAQWWGPKRNVLVIGLGNIGSWLTLMLSKLEPNLALFDMDIVEVHNVGVSSYPLNSVGKLKTEVASKMVLDSANLNVSYVGSDYNEESFTSKITFIGADNMTVRNIAFEKWLKAYGDDPEAIFIDGRSTMEYIETYNVIGGNKDYIEKYKKSLFSDEEDIGELPCSAKSSGHFGAMIASQMVTSYTNHLSNIYLNQEVKMIPSSTSFNGLSYELETKY